MVFLVRSGTVCAARPGMVARSFEELACWQLADELKRRVFAFTDVAPAREDVKYCDQIRESARSVTRNIAEGFGRFRPAEFARFMLIAKGSLAETRNHLLDGKQCGYLTQVEFEEMYRLAQRATGASTRLIAYLEGCKADDAKRRRKPGTRHRIRN